MFVNDDFLFDYCFQPIVNRLLMHPADVAMSTATGSAVMMATGQVIGLMEVAAHDRLRLFVIVGAATTMQLKTLRERQRNHDKMRQLIRPHFRNPLRYELYVVRLCASALALCLLASIIVLLGFSAMGICIQLGITLWPVTLYFECCDFPPTRPARQRRNLRIQPAQ